MMHLNKTFCSKSVFSLMILILFVIFSLPVTAAAASKTEGEIKAALDKLSKAYKKKDINGVMAMYAKGPATTVIGTGEDEKVVGFDAIKKMYETDFTTWKMVTAQDRRIFSLSAAGKTAWLASDLSATYVTPAGVVDVAGRFTAVLKKTGKNWQFVQTHFSFPAEAPRVMVLNFQEIDTNRDGKIDHKELSVVIKGLTAEDFRQLDTNDDKYLTDEEFRAIWGR